MKNNALFVVAVVLAVVVCLMPASLFDAKRNKQELRSAGSGPAADGS